MYKKFNTLIILSMLISIVLPASVMAKPELAPSLPFTFTILHTNDFHGQLEPAGSNPGMARVADVVNDIRAAEGADKVLLVDAGDEMQGSLLSNLWQGVPVIDVFNNMDYVVATHGNHEFDWGQTVLISRTSEAEYPYVSANVVLNDTGDCATAGWDQPGFVSAPYEVQTIISGTDEVNVGFIGVTTQETPFITIAEATEGLCFKDPVESILHYYDELDAMTDVIVVLSHLGYYDGGYGYGFDVYGDQTLAQMLIDAGAPVNLIIGGHSHTDLTAPTWVGSTAVVQAHYAGRKVGRADITVNTDGSVVVNWQRLVVSTTGDQDPIIDALIDSYVNDPDYQELINTPIAYVQTDLLRNYNGNSMMADFVDDAIYNQLNNDDDPVNDVDMFFNNSGGIRTDWCDVEDPMNPGTYIWSSNAADCEPGIWAHDPMVLNYGQMFTILPFGNATIVGEMTGAQIMELLNQAATLFKGAIQPSGIRYSFYRYTDALPGPQPWAWGAFDAEVYNKGTATWEPLELDRVYRVGTNEFLAPAGQDGFVPFKYLTNNSYWGDMLDSVNAWLVANHGTIDSPYLGPNEDGQLDGRITRDGDDTGGTVIPITFLHHNDSHGNLVQGTYVGYTQLATLIKQERAHNPERTLLLNAGDSFQGDAMMYYFKSAGLGYAADGTPLPPDMWINPLMKAFNAMDYDAMTLGNHEFNFGHQIFTSTLKLADFPVLQHNVIDDGQYGLDEVPVEPYVEKVVGPESVRIAILGIGNHRIPNYELPSNIPGLTFTNPLDSAQELSDQLRATNDIVLALTHIGFAENPNSVEVDENVDVNMAMTVSGLDAIIGGHSHTNPATGFGDYKYLPTIVGGPGNTPVVINHAYRYNNTLGTVVIGVKPNTATGFGYDVVSRAGRFLSVASGTPADPDIQAIADPFVALYQDYVNTEIGETTVPIDALLAYTQETNGANLQADASVWELEEHNGIPVDFHLSGAMSNRKVADGATPADPVMLKVGDMFSLMPYENSLVVMEMNGPQIKNILERGYRNYWYYKYIPDYGGYSHYTTCMLSTDAGNQISYWDTYPALPNGNNVASLVVNGQPIDFEDADTYYRVSTVNYLAAGSCNFNDAGVTLWPLDQIANDTQSYVRDAVINYITEMGTVSPAIEGRLVFAPAARLAVGHLAPFAMDPGTAVTVTLNGDAALTNFEFADSIAYISVPPGDYDVEIIPAGSTEPAITGTVSLITGTDYTAIAIGDGANQPLGLLPLVDDNTPPAAGNFHLRIGHLAPFAAGDALADVRLQNDTVILDDVAFGDVTAFLPLLAGEYDLKITSPDGATTYIDPLPVTFNEGDIVSAYAVGDGVNQPLGVFAWPSNAEGFLLPLYEEPMARLAVGHLAPFAVDPGTAVTVTLDGTDVLTGFEFADSTAYLDVTAGITHTVEIFAAGVVTPAISAQINLMEGMDYTAIAVGGANDWPLDLLALLDDNAAPTAGNVKLRMGHLAPFTDTLTGTLADIRLQDGTEVITNVPFGAVTPFIELPAGIYDLKITTPGGDVTLIDPQPVTFSEGDILSVLAVGDGANQPLGVFAWPSNEVGFLLPLEGPKMVYLPLVLQAFTEP